MQAQIGPWLADIAANVLAITVIVLVALARVSVSSPFPQTAETLVLRPVQPLAGAAAVELLRQRLLPQAEGLVDVTAEPTALPVNVSALLILDQAGYPAVVASLSQRQSEWTELTVPDALKTPENGWDPAFLDLAAVARDADRFRSALQDLLTERARTDRGAASAGLEGTGLSTRIGHWVTGFLNLLGILALAVALWGLLRVRRWALTA
jgi:hypothetical protein